MKSYLKFAVPLAGLALATGCPKDGNSNCDSAGNNCTTGTNTQNNCDTAGNCTGTNTGTQNTGTFNAATDINLVWSASDTTGQLTATIDNSGADGFFLGMAETASGNSGWYGEDCGASGVGGCHQFSGTSGVLNYVHVPNDVVLGSTTLFNNGTDGYGDIYTSGGDDRLTYIIQLQGGPNDGLCYVWGDDVSYYLTDGMDGSCQTL